MATTIFAVYNGTMESGDKTPKRGRPPGKARPHKVFGYLDDEALRLLEALEVKLRRSRSDTLLEAVLALAKREGVE